MIRKIKLSFQMLKYAYGLKSNMVIAVLVGAVGLMIEILSHGTSWFGGFFMMILSMFGAQFLYCVSLSNVVLSSPYRKRLQTSMPVYMNLTVSLVVFTILIAMRLFWIYLYPQEKEQIIMSMLFIAGMSVLFSAFNGIAYKYFIISIIFIMVVSASMGFFWGLRSVLETMNVPAAKDMWFISPGMMIFFSYICVFVGAGVQYLISLAIHKKPMSKRAQGAGMKRYL